LSISRKYRIICIAATFVLSILDLLTRSFAKTKFTNTGIAFGLWKNNELTNNTSVILFLLFLYCATKFKLLELINKTRTGYLGVCLFLGGSCSNAIERVFFGHVTDYIEITKKFDLHMNIADIMLIAGFMCIAYALCGRSDRQL
jgi:lipoprotein signal peptidase